MGANAGFGQGGSRIVYIDVAKAIGIMLMVLGHIHFDVYYFDRMVYAFHMPLFFIVSGILYRRPESILGYIGKKAKTLMIPYAIFCAIYFVIAIVKDGASGIIEYLKSIFVYPTYNLPIESALWFLPALLISASVYLIIDIKITNFMWKTVIVCGLTAAGCCWNIVGLPMSPLAISSALSALLFIHFGRCINERKRLDISLNTVSTIVIIVLGCIAGCLVFVNEPLNMRTGRWGIVPLTYTIAIILSAFVIVVSKWMSSGRKAQSLIVQGLSFVGRNSIAFLCVNHLPIMVIRKLFLVIGIESETPLGWGIMFIVAMITGVLLALLIEYTNVGILFGKKRIEKSK